MLAIFFVTLTACLLAIVIAVWGGMRVIDILADRCTQKLSIPPSVERADLEEIRTNAELRFSTYREERKSVIEQYHKTNENHEKTMIALASGALVLSITFLEKIAGDHAQYLPLIAISWILFATSVHLTMSANRMTKAAFKRGLDVLDALYWENQEIDNSYIGESDKLEKRAQIFFYLAVIFLAAFSIINVGNQLH